MFVKKYFTFLSQNIFLKKEKLFSNFLVQAILLSWVFGFCSQISIPLPFNLVPLSIHPMPIFIASLTLGSTAIYAYLLFLAQGALGLPFFAGMQSGVIRLIGPTGGYLIGFFFAALFLASIRNLKKDSIFFTVVKIEIANLIVFVSGLAQLSCFVPSSKLLAAGFYPFIIGDFFVKTIMILGMLKTINHHKS